MSCPLTDRRFPNEQPPALSAGKVPAIPRLQGGAPAGSDSITQPLPSPRGGRGPGAGHPANSYGEQRPVCQGSSPLSGGDALRGQRDSCCTAILRESNIQPQPSVPSASLQGTGGVTEIWEMGTRADWAIPLGQGCLL